MKRVELRPARPRLRRASRALGWTAAGAALGASALAGFTAWTISGPKRPWPPYTFTPFEIGMDAEDVRFTSSDGVRLAGWWFEDPDADTVVICCHGHRGGKDEMLGIGPGLRRAGHSVLLFDFRGSGESADGPQSLAFHEQADLRAAVDWVRRRRPDAHIAVVAFSMGAATALLTAADDDRIEALVLDSPFATMSDVIAANYRRYHLPFTRLIPLADGATWLRYGYRFAQVRPVDAIARVAPRPILLLHGTDDRVVPYEHALQLVNAAQPGAVELVTFEGVDHCGGYFADRLGYIARVDAYLRRVLTAGRAR
ncbi:alpha/beta hydrolase [Nigerium massiliense]|uniref:alpha/beta hydrolase n=1 Tax=Nigerium massiliense TaxID=1522317 RepID=UPI000AAEC76B|nr:alpha/beta hydrolase [Nigerium massiliense]